MHCATERSCCTRKFSNPKQYKAVPQQHFACQQRFLLLQRPISPKHLKQLQKTVIFLPRYVLLSYAWSIHNLMCYALIRLIKSGPNKEQFIPGNFTTKTTDCKNNRLTRNFPIYIKLQSLKQILVFLYSFCFLFHFIQFCGVISLTTERKVTTQN